jgi:hypothetical protein
MNDTAMHSTNIKLDILIVAPATQCGWVGQACTKLQWP